MRASPGSEGHAVPGNRNISMNPGHLVGESSGGQSQYGRLALAVLEVKG